MFGLRNMLLSWKGQIVVNAPVGRVFSELADFTSHPNWNKSIASVQKTSEGPVGVSSTFETRARDVTATRYVEVTEFVPGERLAWDTPFFGGGAQLRQFIELQPSPRGTQITLRADWLKFPFWGDALLLVLLITFAPLVLAVGLPANLWGARRLRRHLKEWLESQLTSSEEANDD